RTPSTAPGTRRRAERPPARATRRGGQATRGAQHVLTLGARPLDYCPPVDITFGDYLRALITADFDLVPDDDLGYRPAVVSAFRRRGIYPHDVRSLSVESLLWHAPDADQRTALAPLLPPPERRRRVACAAARWMPEPPAAGGSVRWGAYQEARSQAVALHRWISEQGDIDARAVGLDLRGGKRVEVHSVRPLQRVGPDGDV